MLAKWCSYNRHSYTKFYTKSLQGCIEISTWLMGLWAAFWPLIPIGHLRLFSILRRVYSTFVEGHIVYVHVIAIGPACAHASHVAYSYHRVPCTVVPSQPNSQSAVVIGGGNGWRTTACAPSPVLRSRTGPLVGSRLSPDRALRRVCSCSDATDGEWIWIGSESVRSTKYRAKTPNTVPYSVG